ncbi:hypothetical protein OROGR_010425 [Orobanche gracilis]
MITCGWKVVTGSDCFVILDLVIQKDGKLDDYVAHRIKMVWLCETETCDALVRRLEDWETCRVEEGSKKTWINVIEENLAIERTMWMDNIKIERDSDKDGKVDFKEFFHGIFDLVRNYDEVDHNSSHEFDESVEAPAKVLFRQLDKDGDEYLSDVELLPIIGKIHPTEGYYAKQQMEYIMQQADTDKDGRLTLTEMIENPYVFYSAVFDENEDDDYVYHDEFR